MKILLSLIFLLGFSFSASADTSVQVLLNNQPLSANLTVYCFYANGVYAGLTARTNTESVAAFNLETGEYKFRHTYEGVQFWSGIISAGGNAQINIPAPTQVFLSVSNQPGGDNQTIYPFTATGVYLGYTKKTNAMSQASFNLPPGSYKFRYTYDGVQFWSNPVMAGMQTAVQVPAPTQVFLSVSNQPGGDNQTIYPFTATGVYLGYTKKTNAMSQALFNLPPGSYKFRYTYDGVQFWSDPVMAGMQAAVQVPVPTPVFLSINNMPGGENQVIYPFSADGTYLGYIKRTNAMSVASFNLFPGDYKFRYTHDGVQFWSDPSAAGIPTAIQVPAPVTEVTVLLGDIPLGADLTVYPFTADGTYLGYTKKTNAQSTAFFDLPEGNYKFRYTHEGVQFWSEEIPASEQTVIQVPTSTQVTVKLGNELLGEDLTVYPFTADGTYLGYTKKTNADSIASFNLPEGSYKFRYMHDGVQFWSEEIIAPTETVLTVPVPTLVTLLLENEPLGEGLTIYPFTADGTYLGYTKKTNADSIASFNLPDGSYKFRYTHDGVQYWSEETTAPTSVVLLIPPHTVITALRLGEPITPPLMIYPFREDGIYSGYGRYIDENSVYSFRLPDGIYDFRMTVDGKEYWLRGVKAGESHLFSTCRTVITFNKQEIPAGAGIECILLDTEGVETEKSFFTDSSSTMVVIPGAEVFRLSCALEDGIYIQTIELSSNGYEELDFFGNLRYRVDYSGMIPADYEEHLCFINTTRDTETCETVSEHGEISLFSGNYDIVYKLEERQQVIDSINITLANSDFEAEFTLPVVRQLALLQNESPLSGQELQLKQGVTEFSALTNSNGHIFFTETGEWLVYLGEEFVGIVPGNQEFTSLNLEIESSLQNTEPSSSPSPIDPEAYGFVSGSVIEVFMPELTELLLNPSQHTYGDGIETEFNLSVLSIPVYITSTAELIFTLYKEPDDYGLEDEPQLIQEIPFTAQTGENEFIWQAVKENGKFLEPGHYFFRMESISEEDIIEFMAYDKNLQLKSRNMVDFAIAY